jgi:hypothetical protein
MDVRKYIKKSVFIHFLKGRKKECQKLIKTYIYDAREDDDSCLALFDQHSCIWLCDQLIEEINRPYPFNPFVKNKKYGIVSTKNKHIKYIKRFKSKSIKSNMKFVYKFFSKEEISNQMNYIFKCHYSLLELDFICNSIEKMVGA